MNVNLTPALALELWREAAQQEVGLRVPCRQADIDKIKPMMYNARKGHLDLQDLMLCVAPGAEEFWIVKRPQEAP